MCFGRFLFSVLVLVPVLLRADTITQRATVMDVEQSLVFFQIVNDYRLNTGKSSEGVVFNDTLSQINVESHVNCAGVRVAQSWVLTTAKCGRIIKGYLAADQEGELLIQSSFLAKAFSPRSHSGVGYVNSENNIKFDDDDPDQAIVALIGLEDSRGMGEYPSLTVQDLGSCISTSLVSTLKLYAGSNCGFSTVELFEPDPDSSAFSVAGQPLYCQSSNDEYKVIALYPDGCLKTSCVIFFTQEIRSFVDSVLSNNPENTLPSVPYFSQDCSVASWTDEPIWESAQGIGLMIGVPLASTLIGGVIGGIIGYGCRKPPTRISQTQMNKL